MDFKMPYRRVTISSLATQPNLPRLAVAGLYGAYRAYWQICVIMHKTHVRFYEFVPLGRHLLNRAGLGPTELCSTKSGTLGKGLRTAFDKRTRFAF
jgi:hypothetical protein